MRIFTKVICPYCGLEQSVWSELNENFRRERVVYCDIEEGGCDKPFVIFAHPFVEMHTRMIEGEFI